MNRKTIEKIIAEIKSENFRKDYVLGILETLLEGLSEDTGKVNVFKNEYKHIPGAVITPATIPQVDESHLLEGSALVTLNKIDKSAIKTE